MYRRTGTADRVCRALSGIPCMGGGRARHTKLSDLEREVVCQSAQTAGDHEPEAREWFKDRWEVGLERDRPEDDDGWLEAWSLPGPGNDQKSQVTRALPK